MNMSVMCGCVGVARSACVEVRVQLCGVASFFFLFFSVFTWTQGVELKSSALHSKRLYLLNHLAGSGYKTLNDHRTMKFFLFLHIS